MIRCCSALCPQTKLLTPLGWQARPHFIQTHFPNCSARRAAFPPLAHSLVPPHAPELNSQFSDTEGNSPSEKPISCYLPWSCERLSGKQLWPGVTTEQHMENCVCPDAAVMCLFVLVPGCVGKWVMSLREIIWVWFVKKLKLPKIVLPSGCNGIFK